MNNPKSVSDPQKARNYCFYLLKFRQRSETEIRRRLAKKGYTAGAIEQAVGFLKEKNFLNDEQFARDWIESRLKRSLGLRKIVAELRLKGVAKPVIDAGIEKIKEDYSEEDTIRRIVRVRFDPSGDPLKEKKRLYAYLLRRGFSPETVNEIISEL